MSLIIYGIPNCDSIKKTMNWCKKNNISYTFHNYKTDGIEISTLKRWCGLVGWENVFNKKSPTWKLISQEYETITENTAIDIMMKKNSIIKRPIIETGKKILIGYNEENLETFCK